ncbi:hypothetical protein BGZ63DRAFT_451652 [Mariannaea sp. PMI_226]|nr:hypothetical protein BGZ63DRAFT_451652 [Mariannaea sp. PMI_226]
MFRDVFLRSLDERSTFMPAVCYKTCNKAYGLAESTGKTPALCAPSSPFRLAYNQCAKCIRENIDLSKDLADDYVDPAFNQFINYCDFSVEITVGIFTKIDGQVQTLTYIIPLADATSVLTSSSTTLKSLPSKPTTSTAQPTSTSKPTISTAQPTSTSLSGQTISTNVPVDSSTSKSDGGLSRVWIAGPVIGGGVVLAVIFAIIFLLKRRAKKPASAPEGSWVYTKAELHADCVSPEKPGELEGQELFELDGSTPRPTELSVEQVPASELVCARETHPSESVSPFRKMPSMGEIRTSNEVESTSAAPADT